MLLWATLTLACVAGLLVAEHRQSTLGRWITKPAASTGFVAAALSAGALDTSYGRAILVALALSWLGDVLLIPGDARIFRAGILAFLLGHVAFVVAFATRGLDMMWGVVALLLIAWPRIRVLRWLRPRLATEMRVPVYAYVTVISLMVVTAAGTFGYEPRWTILAGALAFFLSDLSVARDRFVAKGFENRVWGLPLYYGAQLLFAASVTP